MKYTSEELEEIAEQTGYDCHLCHKPIDFSEYGNCHNALGWEVDHLRPRSKSGHNGLSNLRAAHAHCNRKKGNRSNRIVRSFYGVVGFPPSTTSRFLSGLGYVLLAAAALFILWKILFKKAETPSLDHTLQSA